MVGHLCSEAVHYNADTPVNREPGSLVIVMLVVPCTELRYSPNTPVNHEPGSLVVMMLVADVGRELGC